MSCRLCSGPHLIDRFTVNGYLLQHCQDCDYQQFARPPHECELTKIYSAAYFSSAKYEDKKTLSKELQRRLGLTQKFSGCKSQKLLEFGFGSGEFLALLPQNYLTWGIDLSIGAKIQAIKKFPELANRVLVESIEGLKCPKQFFDFIVSWDTIEHLVDPVTVCQELFHLLKPGGFFIFSTPDSGSWFAKASAKFWPFLTPPEHLGFFSRRSASWLVHNRLSGEIISEWNRGKWVNIEFLLYKIKRIFPNFLPTRLPHRFHGSISKNWAVYVPTKDILYVVVRKSV